MAVIIMANSLFSATAAQAATTADFNTEVQNRYNAIMASMQAKIVNGVDGNDILYSAGWYEDLEPLEVAARCIYGAAPWWIADKKSVAMVMWNRRELSRYPDTLYDVIVEDGEFPIITGSEDETVRARNVDITSASWQNALRYACIIWTARVLGVEPDSYLGVPSGFTNQTHFMSCSDLLVLAYDIDTNSDGIKDSIQIMDADGSYIIGSIFIPVHGLFTSSGTARNAYTNASNATLGKPYNAEGEWVNAYFYH